MKVIHSTDLSRAGNDCYIYESVSLIEAFGMYAIIVADKTRGWFEREEINVSSKVVYDLEEAKKMYKEYGGILEDENGNFMRWKL